MLNQTCNICSSNDFEVKNVYIPTKQYFLKNELYYVRICKCCGKTDFFNAKIVDKNNCKKVRSLK